MSDNVITNPVINSPFEEPRRHFRFTDEGITNQIVSGRRKSAYFVPVSNLECLNSFNGKAYINYAALSQ